MNAKELEEVIWKVQRKMGTDHPLIRCLKRGVGVHHGALSPDYRQAVEHLFRKKYLKIVIATGTLALGIHMPCRTVVFCGDTIKLSALQYRQMSGRAGRRGHDPVGHVVFFGIAHFKIDRLMTAGLSNLSGTWPLSASLIMRLMDLHEQLDGEGREHLEDSVKCMVCQPFLSITDETFKAHVRTYFRYSVDFLVRQGSANGRAKALPLSGLVLKLADSEPANFILLLLLRKGILHNICTVAHGTDETLVYRELLLLLAHLFARVPLHPSCFHDARITIGDPADSSVRASSLGDMADVASTGAENCRSDVVLPSLSPILTRSFDEFYTETLRVYLRYVRTLARNLNLDDPKYRRLPLSHLAVDPEEWGDVAFIPVFKETPTLMAELVDGSICCDIRSPFCALSGAGDTFTSAEELVNTVRQGVRIDIKDIPVHSPIPINAFVWDFYHHGSLAELREMNGMKISDQYALLRHFKNMLNSISASFKKLGPEPPKRVEKEVAGQAEEEDKYFLNIPRHWRQRNRLAKTTADRKVSVAEEVEILADDVVVRTFSRLSAAFTHMFFEGVGKFNVQNY